MENYAVKIVAIGDSITYGFPYMPTLSWVWLAAEELGITIINKGVNGDTTAGMIKRFSGDVLSQKPSHVVIMGGTNDAFAGREIEEVSDNIRFMIEMACNASVIPILGVPILCNFTAEEMLLVQYRMAMKKYAVSAGIEMIDFHQAMTDETGLKVGLYVDGIHPNEAGYEVMAGVAVNFFLDRVICKTKISG